MVGHRRGGRLRPAPLLRITGGRVPFDGVHGLAVASRSRSGLPARIGTGGAACALDVPPSSGWHTKTARPARIGSPVEPREGVPMGPETAGGMGERVLGPAGHSDGDKWDSGRPPPTEILPMGDHKPSDQQAARILAEKLAKQKAREEALAKARREEETKREKAEREKREKAEEEAKKKAEEEAKKKAEEEAKKKAERDARLRAQRSAAGTASGTSRRERRGQRSKRKNE
jgi:hypothetical protein